MLKKTIYKLILIGFVIINFNCSVFKNKPVTSRYYETTIQSKVLYNKLIDVENRTGATLFGKLKNTNEDDKKWGVNLFFKNLTNDSLYGTQTDMDGHYRVSLPSGNYNLGLFSYDVLLKNIELKDGDKRQIDFEVTFGSENGVDVIYKNKRALKKAQQKKKNKN